MNNSWCTTHNSHCFIAGQYGGISSFCRQEEPLAPWERELLRGPHTEGYGDVTFELTNGKRLTIEDVRVDSVSDNGANAGIIAAELENGTIVHVPYVSYWSFIYNVV